MGQIVFLIGLIVGWLQPDHFPPWIAFHNEAPVFIGLALAAMSLLLQKRTQIRIGWGPLVLLGMAAYTFSQLLVNKTLYFGDVALAFAYLGGMALAWVLGYRWQLESEKEGPSHSGAVMSSLAWTILLTASISSAIAWMQWFNLEELWFPWVMAANHTPRSIGNLAQPNQLSTLLLMGVISAGILYEKRAFGGMVATLLVALISSAVVLAQSRTAFLVVVMLLLWVMLKRKTLCRVTWKAVLTWGVFFILVSVAFHQSIEESLTEKSPLGSSMTEIGGRPVLWAQFSEAIKTQPWIGYGWMRTAEAQQVGALKKPGLEQASYTHNHVLDLVTWFGIPFAAILIGLAAWAMWRRYQHGQQDARVTLLVALLAPLAAHSMLEFPLAYAYFLFPAGLILGLLDAHTQSEKPQQWSAPRWLMIMGISVYATLVAVMGYEYIQVEEDFRVARFENRNIGMTPTNYELPRINVLTQLSEVLFAMRLRAEAGMPETDLARLSKSSKRYSWAALHFRNALALGLNDQPKAAAEQMQVIKALFGPKIYDEARRDYLRLQSEKYPELGRVQLP